MLLQIGEVEGAKHAASENNSDGGEEEPISSRRLNKVKTIMSQAKTDTVTPQDELLS